MIAMRTPRSPTPAPAPDTAVHGRGLAAGYGGLSVLTDCDLDVAAGSLTALVGPNGAGKTTLLKLVTGALAPWRGELRIFGGPVAAARRAGTIAYMPQHEAIDWEYPLTVRDVVRTGRLPAIRARGGWRAWLPMSFQPVAETEAAMRALDAVGLAELARRPIGALSGGQKKRVLLARSLVQEARLLLLDEPLAGVDRESEAVIRRLLQEARAAGRTVMMVTHDLDGTRGFADRVLLIRGRVVASGTPEEVLGVVPPDPVAAALARVES